MQSIVFLMSWIWDSDLPEYKSKHKTGNKFGEQIDTSKCLRKLLEFYIKSNG
jgi:hypothetical protein